MYKDILYTRYIKYEKNIWEVLRFEVLNLPFLDGRVNVQITQGAGGVCFRQKLLFLIKIHFFSRKENKIVRFSCKTVKKRKLLRIKE